MNVLCRSDGRVHRDNSVFPLLHHWRTISIGLLIDLHVYNHLLATSSWTLMGSERGRCPATEMVVVMSLSFNCQTVRVTSPSVVIDC